MYNTRTGGKTEMLPFWWILPFWKRKGGGRAVILWKTRFVFDCVGSQHRQDVYCACRGISPPLLWDWINAGIRLLPGVSRAKMQWQLSRLFPSVWKLQNEKEVGGWSCQRLKSASSPSFISSFLSLTFRPLCCLVFCHSHNPLQD